jgi:hypothetical protein
MNYLNKEMTAKNLNFRKANHLNAGLTSGHLSMIIIEQTTIDMNTQHITHLLTHLHRPFPACHMNNNVSFLFIFFHFAFLLL